MTREMRNYYKDYLKSEMWTIFRAYGRPSDAKISIWFGKCHDLMAQFDGYDLKVIRKNCNFFTAGFLFKNKEGKECFGLIRPTSFKIAEIDEVGVV